MGLFQQLPGYTLIDSPVPRQKLVHVMTGAEELGRVYQAEIPILASMGRFARAAAAMAPLDASAWMSSVTRRGRTTSRGPRAARSRQGADVGHRGLAGQAPAG